MLALGSLCAILLAAATGAVLTVASMTRRISQGATFTSEDDPARLEWIRLQIVSQTLITVGPFLAVAAGLAIVALLFVLARRWDARFAYRVVESE